MATKTQKKDTSRKVHQREKIGFELNIRLRDDLTEKQNELIKLITNKETKVVLIKGPAGTSKTFIAILAGLMLLKRKTISELLFVRTLAESASKSTGFLPGDLGSKLEPFLMPLYDKLEELLPKAEADRLINEERVKGYPVNHLRGSSFNSKYVVLEEAQNFTHHELVTSISRIGEASKFVILADPRQIDPGVKSGFTNFYNLFDDEESRANGIHTFEFTKEDIVRSEILKFIADKIERFEQVMTEKKKNNM